MRGKSVDKTPEGQLMLRGALLPPEPPPLHAHVTVKYAVTG